MAGNANINQILNNNEQLHMNNINEELKVDNNNINEIEQASMQH